MADGRMARIHAGRLEALLWRRLSCLLLCVRQAARVLTVGARLVGGKFRAQVAGGAGVREDLVNRRIRREIDGSTK